MGHILPPHAPMAPIVGASCSSQSGLSEHTWVRRFNSRQKPGVTGGEPKNGVLVLNRDRIGHILPPHAQMALIIGASCSSHPGLSEHTWVHRFNFPPKTRRGRWGAEKRRFDPQTSLNQYMPDQYMPEVMQCCMIQFPVEIRNQGWQGELIVATRDETFWEGWKGGHPG